MFSCSWFHPWRRDSHDRYVAFDTSETSEPSEPSETSEPSEPTEPKVSCRTYRVDLVTVHTLNVFMLFATVLVTSSVVTRRSLILSGVATCMLCFNFCCTLSEEETMYLHYPSAYAYLVSLFFPEHSLLWMCFWIADAIPVDSWLARILAAMMSALVVPMPYEIKPLPIMLTTLVVNIVAMVPPLHFRLLNVTVLFSSLLTMDVFFARGTT